MKKKFILAAGLMTISMQMGAQTITVANDHKGSSNGNPISASVFCADPTAIEYEGRLYVYGTNDHQQYIKNNKKGSNGYGNIKSLVVFSTDDMVNWTFHGTIDVGKVCTWAGQSWAPSAVWREKENGTKEFFIYFAFGGGDPQNSNNKLMPGSSRRSCQQASRVQPTDRQSRKKVLTT